MDLLNKIQCQPYSLEILLEDVESDYLEIELRNGYSYFRYNLWNNFESIKEIVEKFVLLYDIKEDDLFIDGNFTSIQHHLDEDNKVVWLLVRLDPDFQIYIWKNPIDFEYLESIYFSSELYFQIYEDEPFLTSGLIIHMIGRSSDFAKTLLNLLDELKLRVKEKSLEDEIDLNFQHNDYKSLELIASNTSDNRD